MKPPALAILVLLLAATASLVAQDRVNSGATGSIHGTVIDTKTSQPLNGATIALHSLQGAGEWNSVTTAPDGRFSFAGLVAGSYRLTATRTGYLDSQGGRGERPAGRGAGTGTTVSVSAGQEVDDVVLRLTPTGVISGRITNERDEPMPGVFVQTMKASYRNGHREFSDARAGFTDDRGEFRVWGLAPGKYYIRATSPRRWETGPAPREIYLPMFYPGVTDPAQTQAVQLSAGGELDGINFTLSPSRAVHLKGRVLTANAAPAKGADVTLAQPFGSGGYSVGAEADANGRFEMPAVPTGSYVITAQLTDNSESSRPLVGRTTVQVSEASVDGVDVTVFPGTTVSGHIRVEGDRKINLTRVSATLRSSDSSADYGFGVGSTAVQADGTFVFHDVTEGNYRVVLASLPDGYYVRASGEDDGGVLVSHGHAAPLEVRVGPGAARIQGTVYKDKDNDKTAPAAVVALVPGGERRLYGEYYRESASDQSGGFVIGNVPPGDYLLFAWQDIEKGAYMDPEFIQQYEADGKTIHVEEGSNSVGVELQLAAPRDSDH
jgi:carboxypeptidase family protein